MSDLVTGYIRTYVPMIVGIVVGWATNAGIIIPEQTSDNVVLAVTGLAMAVWYAIARALESSPKFRWMLGKSTPPTYNG